MPTDADPAYVSVLSGNCSEDLLLLSELNQPGHTPDSWTLEIIGEIWGRNCKPERWQFLPFQIDFRS
jgi:hypothetical protein